MALFHLGPAGKLFVHIDFANYRLLCRVLLVRLPGFYLEFKSFEPKTIDKPITAKLAEEHDWYLHLVPNYLCRHGCRMFRERHDRLQPVPTDYWDDSEFLAGKSAEKQNLCAPGSGPKRPVRSCCYDGFYCRNTQAPVHVVHDERPNKLL